MKNVSKPLARNVLIPAASADVAIQKIIFEPDMTTLIISNKKWMIPSK